MNKIIFGLVGPLASGKGTVKQYLIKKYNAEDCKFSTVLRDVLKRISIPVTRENLQNISTVLRETFGEDLLSKSIAKDVSDMEASMIVIDGVRRPSDIKYLTELPNFVLVKIDASPKVRYERLVLRNENGGDDKKTYEQFLKDHQAEADRLVPEVMASAKWSINNDGSFDDLYKQIDEIVEKLK